MYLLHRVVYETEVLRSPDDRSRDEIGLDQLEERLVEVLSPVAAVMWQHVQQQLLAECRSNYWGFDQS